MDEDKKFNRRSDDSRSVLERHFQTIILSLATAAILFTSSFVYTTRAEVSVMQAQITVLSNQILELRADIKAMQSMYVLKEDFHNLENRFREHELKELNRSK
jgi:Tfp pilus assembly protein PilN